MPGPEGCVYGDYVTTRRLTAPYGDRWGSVTSMTSGSLRQALDVAVERMAALMPELAEAQAQLDALREEQMRWQSLVGSLREVLGDGDLGPAFTERPPAYSPARPDEPVPKRVRSTEEVIRILSEASTPLSRRQILEEFERRGLTAGMKNAANAVSTAVARAVEKGRAIQVGDSFSVSASGQHLVTGDALLQTKASVEGGAT